VAAPPPESREYREALWAIVRASRDLDRHGHASVVHWARLGLGLDEPRTETSDVEDVEP
jgi:hypothetical protein